MKIVLATGTEYEATEAIVNEEGQLCISLIGLTEPLNETIIRKSLTFEALVTIKYYTNETEFEVFENYALLDSYKVKLNENSFDMVIYLDKYADSKRIDELEKNTDVLFDATGYILLDLIPGMKIGI